MECWVETINSLITCAIKNKYCSQLILNKSYNKSSKNIKYSTNTKSKLQ